MPSSKPKDHYVAAGLIGRFSARETPKARESPIYVVRRGKPEAFQQTAENVASKTALYTLEELWTYTNCDNDVRQVDRVWQRLERQMPIALDALGARETDGLVDARLWAETMVPFIASVFVRTPDFNERFGLRFAIEGKGKPLEQADSITRARLFQLQRLFSPVMRASWCVLHTTDEMPFVTSDLAFAPVELPRRPGWVIPLGRRCALHLKLRPRTPRIWLTMERTNQTFVDIEGQAASPDLVRLINCAMALHAPAEIYGDPEDIVTQYVHEMSKPKPKPARVKWDEVVVLRRNQHELLRFLRGITAPHGGDPLSRQESIALMTYPIPIFISVNPKSHMSDKRSTAIRRIEDRMAQKEGERLRHLVNVDSPLRAVYLEP